MHILSQLTILCIKYLFQLKVWLFFAYNSQLVYACRLSGQASKSCQTSKCYFSCATCENAKNDHRTSPWNHIAYTHPAPRSTCSISQCRQCWSIANALATSATQQRQQQQQQHQLTVTLWPSTGSICPLSSSSNSKSSDSNHIGNTLSRLAGVATAVAAAAAAAATAAPAAVRCINNFVHIFCNRNFW